MNYRVVVRVVFALLVVASLATVVNGYVSEEIDEYGSARFEVGEQVAPPRPNGTVITTSQGRNNFIVALAPNGTVTYFNDTYDIYDDVDPVPGKDATVLYVAHDITPNACPPVSRCNLNVVETVNLTTGETTRLYSRMTPLSQNHWHDVDRIGPNRLLVADIAHDRVFILNTTTDVIEWAWNAQGEYPITTGGIYPGDWTHLNDVELLPDGRVMVSLRNQDQVVFIDRQTGLVERWTLGRDGKHSVLFAQHNPDYIPPERGGPAVVVADSENGRIVEYQRKNGSWVQTWAWSDTRLQWPRDADRLPNGHTLVTDTHGGRVFEINEQGKIVWSVEIQGGYDAERIDTGDESTGGESAAALGLRSRHPGAGGGYQASTGEQLLERVEEAVPSVLLNGLLYVMPKWAGYTELAAFGAGVLVLLGWLTTELYWSKWSLQSPVVHPRMASASGVASAVVPETEASDADTDDSTTDGSLTDGSPTDGSPTDGSTADGSGDD